VLETIMRVILSEAKNLSVLVGSLRGVPRASLLRLGFLGVVLVVAGVTCAFAQKQPPPKPLDLNTATVEQLTALPGVGPVIAKAMVDFRTKSGPFRRVEDLLAIRGITERRLAQLRPYVTVQPEKNTVAPASSGAILRPICPGVSHA
jgi:competence ComEA-like helix-hairpin-helix protein